MWPYNIPVLLYFQSHAMVRGAGHSNSSTASFHISQNAEGFSLYEEGGLKGQKSREMTGDILQKALDGKLAAKLSHFKIFQGFSVRAYLSTIAVSSRVLIINLQVEEREKNNR